MAARHANVVAFGQKVTSSNSWSAEERPYHAAYVFSWQALLSRQAISAAFAFYPTYKRNERDSNHAASTERGQQRRFFGKYAWLRSKLDYSYHSNYTAERQLMQDTIIDSIINATSWRFDHHQELQEKDSRTCTMALREQQPAWIVFSAGAMGAGKSWTIRHVAQRGYFPLHSFVTVDPDDVRNHLPEFSSWLKSHPHEAGERTQKEAGLLSELLTFVALEQGRNVLVDGSLRNANWYKVYFRELRQRYASLQIGILHVTAPRHVVLQRAHERSKMTGRVVPDHTLEEALEQVPKSIAALRNQCDYFAEIQNSGGDITSSTSPASSSSSSLELTTGGTWQDFQQAFSQATCPTTATTMVATAS